MFSGLLPSAKAKLKQVNCIQLMVRVSPILRLKVFVATCIEPNDRGHPRGSGLASPSPLVIPFSSAQQPPSTACVGVSIEAGILWMPLLYLTLLTWRRSWMVCLS